MFYIITVCPISSLGENLSNSGIDPDESKVQCIKNISPPKNKEELQNYLTFVKLCTPQNQLSTTAFAKIYPFFPRNVLS